MNPARLVAQSFVRPDCPSQRSSTSKPTCARRQCESYRRWRIRPVSFALTELAQRSGDWTGLADDSQDMHWLPEDAIDRCHYLPRVCSVLRELVADIGWFECRLHTRRQSVIARVATTCPERLCFDRIDLNQPIQPSSEIGHFEVVSQPSPPCHWNRSVSNPCSRKFCFHTLGSLERKSDVEPLASVCNHVDCCSLLVRCTRPIAQRAFFRTLNWGKCRSNRSGTTRNISNFQHSCRG